MGSKKLTHFLDDKVLHSRDDFVGSNSSQYHHFVEVKRSGKGSRVINAVRHGGVVNFLPFLNMSSKICIRIVFIEVYRVFIGYLVFKVKYLLQYPLNFFYNMLIFMC